MKWTTADMPSLKGKLAVVTGANSGLGLSTAIGLAQAGAEVVMACRSPDKAAKALAQVRAAAPGAKVDVMSLDLASLASVRGFAEDFKAKHSRLDLLVNNAGVMAIPYAKTKDGFEMQVGTNHLGHFALTGQLLETLQATPESRVISVASMAHKWTTGMDLEDPFYERKTYRRWDAYGKSKLANLLFMFELNKRLQAANIKVLSAAAHPGYSDTNLGYVGPQIEKSSLGKLVITLGNRLLAQPADMGALPTLYAAAMPDVHGGDYIGPDGLQQMRGYPTKVGCRAAARNPELQRRWWELSEKLTGVKVL